MEKKSEYANAPEQQTERPFIHSTAMNVSHVRRQLGGIEIRTIKFTLAHTHAAPTKKYD